MRKMYTVFQTNVIFLEKLCRTSTNFTKNLESNILRKGATNVYFFTSSSPLKILNTLPSEI